MIKNLTILLILAIALISCKSENKQEIDSNVTVDAATLTPEQELISSVEKAHHKKGYLDKEVLQFDIDLNFGGQDQLDATMYVSTDSKYIRIERTDGSVLLYDGEKVWLSPKEASQNGARFEIFTWSYFFNLPYKLSDDGVNLNQKVDGITRMTFDAGTGDAPDDWYDLYINRDTNMLEYAGYIVTYGGTPADQAALNAHAIGYEAYQELDGIPIAHEWKFYNYNNGVDNSQVTGEATLTKMQFIKMDEQLFSKPADAVEITL
jgi:hypothetical protein